MRKRSMKRTDNTLNALVDMAVRDGHDENSRPVIQKELLHYDILFYLKQSGLLNDLVFQGGTSLGCATVPPGTARIWISLAAGISARPR